MSDEPDAFRLAEAPPGQAASSGPPVTGSGALNATAEPSASPSSPPATDQPPPPPPRSTFRPTPAANRSSGEPAPASGPRLISVVIPFLDESETLGPLRAKLDEVSRTLPAPLEILFIDDGSADGGWAKVVELAARDPRVGGVRLRRNFGKAAALRAGFESARGDLIVTMDADLQDDPAELPKLLDKLAAGYDLVSGWKKKRHDPWHKTYPSFVFNRMINLATGLDLHDHNCGFKLYRREVTNELDLHGELHRFTTVLAADRGFRVGEVAVKHHPRTHGRSKYGVTRFLKGFIDLVTVTIATRFRGRPQHAFGIIALGLIAWAGLFLLWSWVLYPLGYGPESTAYAAWFMPLTLFAIQTFCLGIVAEMVSTRGGGSFESRASKAGVAERIRPNAGRETSISQTSAAN